MLEEIRRAVSGLSPSERREDFLYRKTVADDADEHAENLLQWKQSYDQLSSGRFFGTLTDVWFGGIQLFRETTHQSVIQRGACWSEACSFGVPLAMDGPGLFCDRPLLLNALFPFARGGEFNLRTPRKFDVIGLAIGQSVLPNYLDPTETNAIVSASARSTVLVGELPSERLKDFLCTLFDAINANPDILGYDEVRRALASALLGQLLESIQCAEIGPLPPTSYSARKMIVERAKAHVLAHVEYMELITLAELCQILGISRRTLQYCFQDVFGMNAVQYLRAIRLNGVRRELRNGGPANLKVQDVAAHWGFWHLSRFARDYRSMFGELPSATLRKGWLV